MPYFAMIRTRCRTNLVDNIGVLRLQFTYRTKPIRVEAVQWRTNMTYFQQPHWLSGAMDHTHNRTHGKVVKVGERLQVSTATGTHMAEDGDWIVFYTSTTGELRV